MTSAEQVPVSGFHVVIPARYQSTRLPGKPLINLGGLTVIERVYRQVLKAAPKSIVIATDDERIAKHAYDFGAQVKMTASHHSSGTDRVAEVVADSSLFSSNDIIVNVQGDEPFISPQLILQVANCIASTVNPVATLCWPLETLEQLKNPNIVKVVRNCDEEALYFSRSAIPSRRDFPNSVLHCFRHVGIYAYRAQFLVEFVKWPPCELELAESLEQLRILWRGYKISVETACILPLQDINTKEDLYLAQQVISNSG